jgi:uncharacterized protein (TIGR02646 family)
MLTLPRFSIIGHPRLYLNAQQLAIDNLNHYPSQVIAAKAAWDGRSRAVFKTIRETLEKICHGAVRCHYCEDSFGDEIEHIWPKTFYPDRAFVWQNYLLSCGSCNGTHKNDKFAVFDAHGVQQDIVRGKNAPVIAPPVGPSLFIDPATEDPTDYITLDLQTGLFVPIHAKSSQQYKRAKYTIDTLALNKRDYLSKARRTAYASYKDALEVYATLKSSGASQDELAKKRVEIFDKHHPSVWHEIKMSAHAGAAHFQVFEQSPELFHI